LFTETRQLRIDGPPGDFSGNWMPYILSAGIFYGLRIGYVKCRSISKIEAFPVLKSGLAKLAQVMTATVGLAGI